MSNGASCTSKWCQWIQTTAQLAVAGVIVYAGLIVNSHMESWTESFKQGSEDLHSIRQNMDTIAYSMESINRDMDTMNISVEKMEKHAHNMDEQMKVLNQQVDTMNYSVGGMRKNFSPQGMFRSIIPF